MSTAISNIRLSRVAAKPVIVLVLVICTVVICLFFEFRFGGGDGMHVQLQSASHYDRSSMQFASTETNVSRRAYVHQIFELLDSIDINDQIERIDATYLRVFGKHFDRKAFQTFLDDDVTAQKCMVLTPIVLPLNAKKTNKYNPKNMDYAYLSKLKYSEIHSYPFIVDTLDYLNHLNIPTTEMWKSPTTQQLDEISKEFMSLFDNDRFKTFEFTETIYGISAKPNRTKNFNKTSQRFEFPVTVAPHWNKVLSMMYWSRYSNCVLQTDDDTLIGNYNLSIQYWTHLNDKNTPTLLVLPHDSSDVLLFSNFGFILSDPNKDSTNIQKLLLLWWENRKKPFDGGFNLKDQDAMYHARARRPRILSTNSKSSSFHYVLIYVV
eukprot:247544_1